MSRWTRRRSSGENSCKHGEALIQSFEQLPFSRILLDRANGLLDFADLTERHLIADELGFQLAEVIESSRPIDQLGIGNGIGRSREEIGQTHLVPHVRRHHGESRIEQAGHALEEIAQKGPFRTVSTRDATFLVRGD